MNGVFGSLWARVALGGVIALGTALLLVLVLLSGGDDDDAATLEQTGATPTGTTRAVVATSTPTPTAPSTAAATPTPRPLAEADAARVVTIPDPLLSFAGGTLNRIRTNDSIATAFSSSPTTGPFIETQ